MRWRWRKKKQAVIDVFPVEEQVNIQTNNAPIIMGDYTPPPYKEPTDKELVDGLYEGDNYEAASRITELKRENANLKRKLTILQKKYDGIK